MIVKDGSEADEYQVARNTLSFYHIDLRLTMANMLIAVQSAIDEGVVDQCMYYNLLHAAEVFHAKLDM